MTACGLLTGTLVGITGMGGGALTMPLLTPVFGVPPMAAVSTDLVANAVLKPVGAAVHLRRRTVNLRLIGLLCAGSLPCAAIGSALAGVLGQGEVHVALRVVAGAAVLLAAVTSFVRMRLDVAGGGETGRPAPTSGPVRTVAWRALAGLAVGTTSVGSGSIVVVCLLVLEHRLSSAQLVGTDLVQAVPLVLVAAIGHLLVGEVDFELVAALLMGALPGVLAGATLSSRIPHRPVRVLLGVMLVLTGLLLVGVGTALAAAMAVVVGLVALAAPRANRTGPAGVEQPVGTGREGGTR